MRERGARDDVATSRTSTALRLEDEVVEIRDVVDSHFPLLDILVKAGRRHRFPVPLEIG